MSMDFDFSDITRLVADLADVPKKSEKHITTAVKVTALKVKQAWRGKVAGSPGLGGIAPSINFDIKHNTVFGSDFTEAEIGADKGKAQGDLANVSEFGTPFHPPRGFGLAALQENIGDFEKGLGNAVDDGLKESGF